MAEQVDRVGSFRFDAVLDAGVSETKNGFPSFNARLRLSEYYDEDEQQWVNWSEYDMEITAYFTLFGKDRKTGQTGPILNHKQVMDVFGWDGRSFLSLANGDYSTVQGQIRVGVNDYEGAKNLFRVEWLDQYDADPVRQLRKLDADSLKGLDKKFASALQSSGKAPVAASAKKPGKPTPPKLSKPASSESAPEEGEEDRKTKMKEKSERLKAAAKKPTPPARKSESSPQESPGGWTKQKAWETIVELKNDEIDDETLADTWHSKIDELGGEGKIVSDQWNQIVHAVLDTEYEEGKTVGKF